MLIAGYAQEVSSRRKDRRNRTHVDHSLTCCSEENSKVQVIGYDRSRQNESEMPMSLNCNSVTAHGLKLKGVNDETARTYCVRCVDREVSLLLQSHR